MEGISEGIQTGVKLGRLFAEVLAILVRPLALITQVFYRKDMGERYCAPWHLVVGIGLISLAYYLNLDLTRGSTQYKQDMYGRLVPLNQSPVTSATILKAALWSWIGLVALASLDHRRRIRARYRLGTRWHSMCMGVPRLPGLTDYAQYAATAGIAVAAWYANLPMFAGLLAASLWAGWMQDEFAAKAFWNRVLDAVDAQIDAENLGKAVEARLKPAQAEGAFAYVPAYVSPEGRGRVAAALHASIPAKPRLAPSMLTGVDA